jgi:hypothetical protein
MFYLVKYDGSNKHRWDISAATLLWTGDMTQASVQSRFIAMSQKPFSNCVHLSQTYCQSANLICEGASAAARLSSVSVKLHRVVCTKNIRYIHTKSSFHCLLIDVA